MNQMAEEECFEVIESVLEHPNIEVFQLADRVKNAIDIEKLAAEVPKKGKKGSKAVEPKNAGNEKLSICKGI